MGRSHQGTRFAAIARALCRYRTNIIPLLGGVTLNKLRPAQIAEAYATALASGRRDGKGGLSPRTVHHMHRILKQALGQAVKWELLNRNPCDAVDPPKVERTAMHTFDLPQTAALIDALRGTRMLIPALLAVLCGLRRGELAALRWRNVDLGAGQIAVVESAEETKDGVRYKEPKSGRARTVALSSTMIDELKAHRARQAQELLKLGVRLSRDSFVVAQADASPLKPTSITHEWVRLLGRTTLPRIRFHDLRHAHATHMLASGVHPKIASERLGHSKVGITLDLYSHVLPNMQADAVAQVDDALRAAINKRTKDIG
ncbi:site-specific integrase [Nitrobacter sp. Nb-311A]|uniref:tyrosine-type recombinase/integrase n=1 Tax=Nitrobacter sp. Nb-311A TaxID=314253 RepID=UPI000323E376|nr:site-specific integrase [Nitrobacter sp. Nb-311A]